MTAPALGRCAAVVLLGLGVAGCKGGGPDAGTLADPTAKGSAGAAAATAKPMFVAEVEHTRAGWIGVIHGAPKTFQSLAKTSAGWAKLFKGELTQSVESFRDSMEELEQDAPERPALRIGLGRALYEVGSLLSANGQLHVRLLKEYFETREKRRPPGTAVNPSERLFHGIALILSGDSEGGLSRLDAVIAQGEKAKPWLGQALAWKGFAGKDRKENWRLANDRGPEAADWVSYLRCRAGQAKDVPAGGSPMRDRLRVATLACMGKATEALAAAQAIAPKAADQVDSIPALSGDAEAGITELKYHSPVFLQELGRAWLLQADQTLEQMVGCPAYWRGRIKQSLGDRQAAIAALRAVGDAHPEQDFACTLFSAYQDRSDLRFDGERRAEGLEGKAVAEGDDKRLIRRAWRLNASLEQGGDMANLQALDDIPEDTDDLSTALEEGLSEVGTEDGRSLAVKVRALQQYGAAVLRAKATTAARVGEHPLALKLLQATHDNQKTDRVSPINRPSYLLDLGIALWNVKQRRPAVVYMQELSGRFPELWQNVEIMNRVDAIFAVGGGDAPVQGQ